MSESKQHFRVVVVGGGTGGVTAAARLARKLDPESIAIVEPSQKHYYQPLWTLVGAGVDKKEVTEHSESSVIPRGVQWIQDAVSEFDPEQNEIVTRGGQRIGYEYLVVAAGIQIDWGKVKGLQESIGKDGVCSNYAYEYVDSTWENIHNFQGGTAIFTQPSGAIKCGGAPQKIMYLAEDYFRQHGLRDKSKVIFVSAGAGIFSIPKYAETLKKVVERKEIETHFRYDLEEIRPDKKEAVFRHLETGEPLVLHYDMIHVTPPMSSPDFIKHSPLADDKGWVEVDKYSLQHVRYPNVFALGDASSLPTSKTGAAIRKQAPVLVKNLLAHIAGQPLAAKYNGYTSCPVVTGYGKLVLAEFDYDHQPAESFPFNQAKERYSMWLLKRFFLPVMYWYGMLKGRM